jgi:ribonuclease Z
VQRDNTFLGLQADSANWLIDCGGSPYQNLLRVGLSPLELRGVVLTHAHPDHIYGLPALLFQLALASYGGELQVFGLSETLRRAKQIVESFGLGVHCARHNWQPVRAEEGQVVPVCEEAGVRICVARVVHSTPALGVRIEGSDGGVIAYSGDTQPCAALVKIARGAHWLLHECTAESPMPGHSTAEGVGQVAAQAGVERVGVVHYDPTQVVSRTTLLKRIQEAGFGGEVRVLEHHDAIEWRQ